MDKSVSAIFNDLLSAFGPQGWWPVTPIGQTKQVYHPSNSTRSLTPKEQTEIMIGAILTRYMSFYYDSGVPNI
ncbi:MAG: hypothetical protein AABX47_03380 [Nanoarchaeota archaeon]